MNEGLKVVTAQEMARIEKGGDQERFMDQAGRRVAEAVGEFIAERGLAKKVALLVGKGNNGGDAYAAGAYLLDEEFEVKAYAIGGECSVLNRKFRERFEKKRGRVEERLTFDDGVIVDGLLGTGFRGKIEGEMAEIIRLANGSGRPIIAIDIPSGLNGTTGEVGGVAIVAEETVALGLPKWGFFVGEGWNHVGRLRVVDFGLSREAVASADAVAYMPKRVHLPKIVRNRHKYQAGYVIGFGGSKELSGAVKLSGLAALRAGAGMVRIYSLEEIGPAPLELICCKWDEECWDTASKKARAVFVGPGLGRSKKAIAWLKKYLGEIELPCVVDADALMPGLKYPKGAVLTPHRGEALRLLGLKTMPKEEELFAKVMRFCESKKVVVILKGAPTFVFGPGVKPIVVERGDPGMAKAGTGDVLTGVVAALLAQGCVGMEAAVLGVMLHGIAGETAALEKSSYCVIASDLIEAMPIAFQVLGHDIT